MTRKSTKPRNNNGQQKPAGVAIWHEVQVDITALKPFDKNPRTMSAERYQDLLEQLRKYGLHNRIRVTHDFRVIGGHQRIKALKELGYRRVPVLVPPPQLDLTDDEFLEQVIRDNTHGGTFDSLLALELAPKDKLIEWGIPALSLDMPAIGGSEDEQGKLDEVSFLAGKKKEVECPECHHKFKP